MEDGLSYKQAGVHLEVAEAAKAAMARSLATDDPRVLNRLGPFASLFEASFPGYEDPVLVLKVEEPGSKQKLALEHGHAASIAYDLVNHLVNDIIVMGAEPLAVLDCIVCGELQKEVVVELVDSLAAACREQGCSLVGGETSEQRGVVEVGTYVVMASIVGVVERYGVIDGSKVAEGDVVLAVASNGLHTNGYSLVRALMAAKPEIADADADGERFLDAALRPHKCYQRAVRGLFELPGLHGMAHITGGGIAGNLKRILPDDADAVIDLSAVRVLPVFRVIRNAGKVEDAEMLRTFNMGVGMALVVEEAMAEEAQEHISARDCDEYVLGHIRRGRGDVELRGNLVAQDGSGVGEVRTNRPATRRDGAGGAGPRRRGLHRH
ncbi:MAG: phosphoribosylformylglycinamidine cyclo-ligase [Planctomycetota bacterium]|jgi:phosphoribosylformylglycinamidine cyclo-ligase